VLNINSTFKTVSENKLKNFTKTKVDEKVGSSGLNHIL